MRNELAANDAKCATERLLKSLCDAVVQLGPDLRIIQATPHFMHLLCPSTLVAPGELEGTQFLSLLASGMKRFVAYIAMTADIVPGESKEGPAPALHVTLKHALGREVDRRLIFGGLAGVLSCDRPE